MQVARVFLQVWWLLGSLRWDLCFHRFGLDLEKKSQKNAPKCSESSICNLKITLTISTTKRVNTCWVPCWIWDIDWLPKMKSCLGCCSQRSCAASCNGFSMFEVNSEKSELHFVVSYVVIFCFIQKTSENPIACFCQPCWVTATYGTRTLRPFFVLDSRSFCSNILLGDYFVMRIAICSNTCTNIL